MSRTFSSTEVLEHLVGIYEITFIDHKAGTFNLSFWMSKNFGNRNVPFEGEIYAVLNGEAMLVGPARLDTHALSSGRDTCQHRLGMRLPLDALPDSWRGECEFRFARTVRCFPFKGISDITASLKPATIRPSEQSIAP